MTTLLSLSTVAPVPDHGGNRTAAARRHGIPEGLWLDLSTGINPFPYPLPTFPPEDWTRLPDAALEEAACAAARTAYGVPPAAALCLAPGSQALIQALPWLLPRRPLGEERGERMRGENGIDGSVAVLAPTYGEHARCWALAGHPVQEIPTPDALPPTATVLVVVNPNNPDGRTLPLEQLEALRQTLLARSGLLVIDEAFADVDPALSAVSLCDRPGVLVLRSFGKFYGLAGVRLGIAIGSPALTTALSTLIGPWAVSGPALRCAAVALADTDWAAAMRTRLAEQAARLDAVVLAQPGFTLVGGLSLFRLYHHPDATGVAERLARKGILGRVFSRDPSWLRLGLPDAPGLDRLRTALQTGA